MIRLVVALAAEARPLIARWKMRRTRERPWPVYAADGLRLVVSGPGTHLCAAATGYLAAHEPPGAGDAWINVGVAGGDAPLGSSFVIHRVVDAARGDPFYPQFAFAPPCPGTELITVAAPHTPVSGDALHDMEGSGFAAVAGRLATAEMVHLLKVVSDNPEHHHRELTAADLRLRMESVIDVLGALMESLAGVGQELEQLAPDARLEADFTDRWRMSDSQRHALRGLLLRARALGITLQPSDYHRHRDARALLAALRSDVDAHCHL